MCADVLAVGIANLLCEPLKSHKLWARQGRFCEHPPVQRQATPVAACCMRHRVASAHVPCLNVFMTDAQIGEQALHQRLLQEPLQSLL
jgi:hypothetical protein